MVTVAEILKGRRLAVEKRLTTSLESLSGEYRWVLTPGPAPQRCACRASGRSAGQRTTQDAPEAQDGGAAGEVRRI